jgi:hypothetical protein
MILILTKHIGLNNIFTAGFSHLSNLDGLVYTNSAGLCGTKSAVLRQMDSLRLTRPISTKYTYPLGTAKHVGGPRTSADRDRDDRLAMVTFTGLDVISFQFLLAKFEPLCFQDSWRQT